ncbi:hypothetical protein ACFLQW_02905 [Candidatus Zixiibacteriota bacterium]
MRQKRFVLPILLVFVFTLSLSFSASMQEAKAGDGCPPFCCVEYCICRLAEWCGEWDTQTQTCDLETNCFAGPCSANPCE